MRPKLKSEGRTELPRRKFDGLSLVPAGMRKESPKSAILEFGEAHTADFPISCNMNTFKAEMDVWIDLFADQFAGDLSSIAAEAFKIANNNPLLPTISRLLCLIWTWPVTSVECERSISGLK